MFKKYGVANVLDTEERIKHLYHISDIHIRLNNYHKEYRHVFNNLYQNLENRPKGLIVVTGDILHSKNELSPECILLTLEFLETLASIMPTIIIAGNHDAVLTNNDRVDSLTGILDKREIVDLYYLKHSGIYKFNNIYFGVNSLLDGYFVNGSDIKTSPGEYKVALYHGSVGTPINDFGYKISGEIPLSTFDNYDYVLLGDIHKFQYLNPEQTVAYASSLISQNFGESDIYHGYLEWNLQESTTTYNIIDNPYRYIRHTFSLNTPYPSLTTNAKLQVSLSKIMEVNNTEYYTGVSTFKSWLRREHPNVKATFIYSDQLDTKQTTEITTDNLIDKARIYIKTRYPAISDTDIQWLIDNISWTGSNKLINTWRPIYMTWSYMCRYGKDNCLNFNNLSQTGINGIIQKNSAGKSSFIDILTFLLFGRMNRNVSNRKHIQPDIINVNQKKCSGTIYFSVHTDIYMITRTCSRGKDDNIKMISTFHKLIPGDGQEKHIFLGEKYHLETLTGKDRYETDKYITELIGIYEDFAFHSLFLQFDNVSFRKMSPRERKDFMYRLFDLEQFTNQYNGARDRLKKSKNNLDYVKSELCKSDPLQITENLEKLRKERDIYHQELIDSENKLTLLRTEINELNATKTKLDDTYKTDKSNMLIECKCQLENIATQISNMIFVGRQDEILEKYREFVDTRERKMEKIRGKINSLFSLVRKVVDIDFNIDKYRELSNITFPNDIDSQISSLQNIIYKYGNHSGLDTIVEPEYSIDYIDETLLAINTKIAHKCQEIDMLRTELSYIKLDGNIENEYLVYSDKRATEIANNKNVECILCELENSLKEYADLEYNPDCYVCTKNPKVKVLQNILTTIENTRQKSVVLTYNQDLEHRYENYTQNREKYMAITEQINSNTCILNELYAEQQKYKNMAKDLAEWQKIVEVKKSRQMLLELLAIKTKQNEFFRLNTLYSIYTQNIETLKHNVIIDKQIEEYNTKLGLIKSSEYAEYNSLQIELLEYNKLCIQRIELENRCAELELYGTYHDKYVADYNNNISVDLRIDVLNNIVNGFEKKDINYLLNLESQITELACNLETHYKHQSQIHQMTAEYTRLKYLEEILGVNGFSLYLLKDNLENMSAGISEILKSFIGVSLKLDIVDNDLVVYSYRETDTEHHKLDTFGGMETLMYDLSFRLYSVIYSHLPFSNLLILDETFVSFDSQNLMNVEEILKFLSKSYTHIIMITHIDVLKDFITKRIDLATDDQYSHIKFA
jgi:DNA repair exonuclease SbcCD ATPase subunit/DNA repair exonuclease SbcCD nuclease subunit